MPLLATPRSEGIIIRSSATLESINERGKYRSPTTGSSARSVRAGIAELWRSTSEQQIGEMEPGLMAAGLQPLLSVVLQGHLSNEHRVCRDITTWLLEGLGDDRGGQYINVRASQVKSELPLHCNDIDSLRRQLRAVARTLSDDSFRYHAEWVWDGSRLWIVQCDRVPVLHGAGPGDAWQPARGRGVDHAALQVWQHVDAESSAEERWAKLECRREFANAGLPVVDVFILSGSDVIASLARGESSDGLLSDLGILCGSHLIVRTDVAGTYSQLMLPKSGAEVDLTTLLLWMQEQAKSFIERGIDSGDLAFIAHRFLRSRACAWSYARPGDSIVRVDSIWGLNDGLGWLPHDVAAIDANSGELTTRSIRGKPSFLDVAPDSRWLYRETPTEWVWRASATEDQLRTIARGAHRLAASLNRPVITMWFIGLLDGAQADVLPWFQASWDIGSERDSEIPNAKFRRHVIRTERDLTSLPAGPIRGEVLQLKPSEDLIRDMSFVDRIVAVCSARGLVVEIDGSPLAHPYYILRRAGIPVYSRSPSVVDPVETRHNKLVRDQIPEVIVEHGEHPIVYRADDLELRTRLRVKLVEEALELLGAPTRDDEIAESADLLEVFEALERASSWTRSEVEIARLAKHASRGGFDEGLILVSTAGESRPIEFLDEDVEALPGLAAPRALRPLVRRIAGGVEVSLIPPAPGEMRSFETRIGDRAATVVFRESTILFSLQGVSGQAAASFEQPDLWE